MIVNKKIALVTGSTSGIGKSTALELLNMGYFVIISCEKPQSEVNLDDFSNYDFEYLQIDITKKQNILDAVDKIKEKYSRLDCLVNNAGVIPKPCSIDEITDEVIDKTINTNLKGTFFCLKHLGKLIQESNPEGKGAIVNLTSVDGIIGEPYNVIYSATKAGIISLTKSFARYFNDPLVRVNAVAPGLIDTPLTTSTGEDPSLTTDVSIIQRIGTSEEIAKTIVFLLSEDSSYTTGQIIAVDGGFTLK